jgi:hypothetical protein
VDVFDGGASQVERPTFVGYTGVQNGLFWCVHEEGLRSATDSFPIFASYILITNGKFFNNEIGIANFTKCC